MAFARLMDLTVEHGAKTPVSNRLKRPYHRNHQSNRLDLKKKKKGIPDGGIRPPFNSTIGSHVLRRQTNTNKSIGRVKTTFKKPKTLSRPNYARQSREKGPRSAPRRQYVGSSQRNVLNNSDTPLFRRKSNAHKVDVEPNGSGTAHREPKSAPAKCEATSESAITVLPSVLLSDVSLPSNRTYFRRPSRYKPRKPVSRPIRSKKASDVSKAAASKTNVASGWEQKSTNFTIEECHEAFIKAFAIPTHLYRYLAQRHRQRPLFLDRNLSYLRAPPSFSSASQMKRPQRSSVNAVVERLHRKVNRNTSSAPKPYAKQDLKANLLAAPGIPNFSSSNWPQEVQLIFEGFFDSEKELDWVTVDASVSLMFRFGWSWRHKVCSTDTLVSPCQTPIPLTCHHPTRGSEQLSSQTPSACSTECRFCPLDVIEHARWITSGSRLSSGQLELRVSAVERRLLKRRSGCTINGTSLSTTTSITTNPSLDEKSLNRDQSLDLGYQLGRRGGLGCSSYPVHYATAPLPLFYPTTISNSLQQSHPFLLTPGLYELRLGVDHGAPHTASDKFGPDKKLNGNGLENGSMHDAASTTDSLVTSTSDFPSGTTCSVDEVSSLAETAGAVSGRVEWRRVRFPKASDALDEYSRWPTLKFRVVWHGEAPREEPISPAPHQFGQNGLLLNGTKDERASFIKTLPISPTARGSVNSNIRRLSADLSPLRSQVQPPKSPHKSPESNGCTMDLELRGVHSFPLTPRTPISSCTTPLSIRPVAYRFLYMGHLQQWSESRDLICPWCQLDCGRARKRGLEALLVHLRTCHPRFRFKAIWGPSRSHLSLEVSLNEAYDGSNDCGLRRWAAEDCSAGRVLAPGQLLGGWTGLGSSTDRETGSTSRSLTLVGCTTRVSRPVRRLPYTHLIFWRGAEQSVNQPLDPTLSVRPMAVGHNRVYYHTRSVQPIRACEFDVDSEAEDAPVWLCQHYQRKVEEFTDVNLGEKQIMQLWNSLLLSIGPSQLVVCDNQIANLAAYFLHRHALTIHRRRLRNNLLLHFANLTDYGLLSPTQLRHLVAVYDKLVEAATTSSLTLTNEVSSASSSCFSNSASSCNFGCPPVTTPDV